jgi:hypothetical protein
MPYDALDRYRQVVEEQLGEQWLRALGDDTEMFFDHVIACFDHKIDPGTCALAWREHGD